MLFALSRRLLPRATPALPFPRAPSLPCPRAARPVLLPSRAASDGAADGADGIAADDARATPVLNRDDLAGILREEHGLTNAESRRILATVFDSIVEAVANEETVVVSKFGKFFPRPIAAQVYRNPQDPAQSIPKPATTRVGFKAFEHFRASVAAGGTDGRGTG